MMRCAGLQARKSLMSHRDPASRYEDRAGLYARHRPRYPDALRVALLTMGQLRPGDEVADVGSGTGLLSELLLSAGCRVFAVEPSAKMREEAERRFAGEKRFVSVKGSAERTTLPDASVDLVAAGQAFHWFEPVAARAEFLRVLRSPGRALLVWNVRRAEASSFMTACERLIAAHATDPELVGDHIPDEAVLATFFGGSSPQPIIFHHEQTFDEEGLIGRLLSCSFVPGPAEPGRETMIEAIHALFARHQENGAVRFIYETRAYSGTLKD